MNSSSVIVNILVNANNSTAINQWNIFMNSFSNSARNAAQQSALSFDSMFGANFFANLASSMVTSFTSGFTKIVSDAIQASSKMESAFKGLESLGRNTGLSGGEGAEAVRNLDIVRNGLLSVGDAATATKNLLASGFSLAESIELIKRFADTAAFGRQSALSFGYAIASATEGIKNSNSILVDNAGVTKNLSVIMKEAGRSEQDLLKIRSDSGARLALYNGLIKETVLQQGDATRVLETYQGKMIQLDSAYNRFLAKLGDTVTQSRLVNATLGATVSVLEFLGNSTGSVIALATAIGVLTAAIILMNTSAISSLPVISSVISSVQLLGKVMVGTASLMSGATATMIAATAGWAALVIAVGAVVYAIYKYSTAEKESVKITIDSIEALKNKRAVTEANIKSIDDLSKQNVNFQTAQQTQIKLYQALDTEAQRRIDSSTTEAERVANLRKEYEQLRNTQTTQLQADARIVTGNLAEQANKYADLKKQIDENIAAEKKLRDQQAFYQSIPDQTVRVIGSQGGTRSITGGEEAIRLGNEADRLKSSYAGLREEQNKVIEEGKKFYNQQGAMAQVLGTSQTALIESTYAFNNQSDKTEQAKNSILSFANAQGLSTTAINKTTDAVQAQIDSLNQLKNSAQRFEVLEGVKKSVIEEYGMFGDIEGGVREFKRLREINPELDKTIRQKNAVGELSKQLDELISPKQKKAAVRKSEFDSLSGSIAKLKGEVKSYSDMTSNTFKLRFEKEELERVKQDFEKIISLRRELGIPINTALSAEGAKAEIEYLERVKSLRDSIIKITKEGIEAEDRLMVARIASILPVVDAQRRADTSYFEGLRKRADSEQQLTAEIIGEIRRREMAQTDSSRNVATAQAEAYKDFLQDQNNRDADRLKQLARLQLMAGGLFSNNPLLPNADQNKLPATQSPVLSRMDKTNDLLQQILTSVSAGSGTTGTQIPNNFQKGVMTEAGLRSFIEQRGFTVTRTKGAAINKGSLHPLGLAADISIKGKTPAQLEQLISELIGAGYRVVDERKPIPGIKQTAPHIHAEINPRRQSTFQSEDFYSSGTLSRLRQIDQMRFGNTQTTTGNQVRTTGDSRVITPTVIDSRTGAILSQGDQTSAVPDPINAPDFSKVSQDYRELTAITEKYLGMKADDKRLNAESISALDSYLMAQRRVNEEGIEGIRLNAIGQDRLNQATNVQVRQVEELAVSERRLNDLRTRESVSVLEVLNNAEKARNESAQTAQRTIIESADFVKRFDEKDLKILQYLSDLGNADVAARTTQAIQNASVSGYFIDNVANPETQRMLDEEFRANRQNTQAGLLGDLEIQRRQLATGGRDREIEDLNYIKERNSILLETGRIEAQIEQDRRLNSDAEIQRTRTQNEILNERNDLENRLAQIQVQMSSSGANQALREQVALNEELLNIRRADLDASERLVRLQVQLADKQVYHQEQANARVLEHINSIDGLTDIYANAKIQIVDGFFGGIDSFFTRITGKIPILSNILSTFLSSITKLIVSPFIARVLGVDSGGSNGFNIGGSGGSGSGSGGGIAGLIQSLLFNRNNNSSGGGSVGSMNVSGLNTSGGSLNAMLQTVVPQFGNQTYSNGINSGVIQQMISGASGGSSQIDRLSQQQIIEQIQQQSGSGSVGGVASGATGLLKNGLNLKGIGGAFGAMAPLFGLQLGLGLGKGSIPGSIMGGLGGLLAGGVATAFLAPSVLTGVLGGTIAGSGIGGAAGVAGASTGLGGAAAAFLTNPFTIAGAGALLVGAYLLSRNSQRRRDEETRSKILVDSKEQIRLLIEQVRGGKMDAGAAMAQAAQIRQAYISQVQSLKSDKVRKIALATVREIDAMIEYQLKPAIRQAETASATDNAIVPTFDSGGGASYVALQQGNGQFTGFGGSSYGDHIPAILKRNEVILTPQNIGALGGFDAMRRAGVRGIDMFPKNYDYRQPSGSGSGSDQPVYNIFAGSEKMANEIFDQVKGKGVARKLRLSVYTGDDDGFLDTIEKGLAGDF